MRTILVVSLAILILGACAPAFQPSDDPPPGVTLTSTEVDGGTLYRVDTDFPIERLFLRFHGAGLHTEALECEGNARAIECTIGAVTQFYELTVEGDVQNDPLLPYGVACRTDCWALYLTR